MTDTSMPMDDAVIRYWQGRIATRMPDEWYEAGGWAANLADCLMAKYPGLRLIAVDHNVQIESAT